MPLSPHEIAPWLLRSKVTPPRQMLSVLLRPSLISVLDQGGQGTLILLEAPGGYGKSCLLSEWRSNRQERGDTVCWLSVDEDDDADTFLAYLAFSAQMAGIDVSGSELMSFEYTTEKIALQSVYQLLSLFERHSKPVHLIIDDCERLSDTVRQSVMPLLLRRIPENCTLVLASREAVELNTVDFEHRGLVTRIGPRQMRFSRDELQQLWGARVTARQLLRIEDQTEGWPVLVRLLLSAADIGEFDIRHIDEISHSDISITTYFEQKILSRLDPEMRELLMAASVFDDISDAILEEILGVGHEDPLRASLDSLEAFVAPISGENAGYRLHPMMRDYLLHRLENESYEQFCDLQERAARWYSRQGNHVKAVRHALAGKNQQLLISMLEETGGLRLWLLEGLIEFRPIDRLLSDEVVLASPTSGFIRTIILMKSGRQSEAAELFDRIVTRHGDKFDSDEMLSISAFACKIMLSIYRGLYISPEEIEAFETSTLETATMFAGYVLTMKCVSAHQSGYFQDSLVHAEKAITYFQKTGSVYGEFYIHLHLGMVGWLMGAELSHANAFVDAKNIIRRELSGDTGVKPLLEILKQEYEHEAAPYEVKYIQRQTNVVINLMKGEGWLDIYASAFRTLSEKQYFTNGVEEALLSLDTFSAFAAKNDMRYLLDICRAERTILLAAEGRVGEAAESFEEVRDFKVDPASYLADAPWRAGEAVGEAALFLEAETMSQEDIEIWQAYRDLNLQRGNKRLVSRLSAMLAARPNAEADLAILDSVIGDHFTRSISLCYHQILENYDFEGSQKSYVHVRKLLLNEYDRNQRGGDVHPHEQSILTEKEMTVLQQLAQGQADKQIALYIGITEHGVRYHLKNIYAKLGAQSRFDAVQRSRSLGFLES